MTIHDGVGGKSSYDSSFVAMVTANHRDMTLRVVFVDDSYILLAMDPQLYWIERA